MVEAGPGDAWRGGHRDVAVVEDVHVVARLPGPPARAATADFASAAIESVEQSMDGAFESSARRQDRDRSPGRTSPSSHHAGVHPAVGRMVVDQDAAEPAVTEVGLCVSHGHGRTGQLEHELIADARARPNGQQRPLDAGRRQVLADAARLDRVALGLQAFDGLDRVQAHGAVRATVRGEVGVPSPSRPSQPPTPGQRAAWARRRARRSPGRRARCSSGDATSPRRSSGGDPWQTPRPWLLSRCCLDPGPGGGGGVCCPGSDRAARDAVAPQHDPDSPRQRPPRMTAPTSWQRSGNASGRNNRRSTWMRASS